MARPTPLIAAALITVFASPTQAAEPTPVPPPQAWTMALTVDAGDPRRAVAEHFAQCVRDASVGKLTLALEPAPEPRELAAAVLAGTPRLATLRLTDVPAPDALFGLETIAYLAPDLAKANKLWTAARLDLDRTLATRGYAFLFSAAAPPAGLFAAAAPTTRAELAKLRLAAPTAAGAALLTTLGIEPAPLTSSADSVALAALLRAGTIDGFAAEPTAEAAAAASTGMIFLDLDAMLPREVVVANRAAFEPLPADAKTGLVACGDQAIAEGTVAAEKADQAARAALAARGIQQVRPSAPLVAELTAYGQSRLADWLAATGVTGKAVLDSFRAM
jgi:TRAP-type C4-dicarboxylate transport system substrate-binding protein